MTRTLVRPEAEIGTGPVPVLIVADEERRRLAMAGPLGRRLLFYDRVDLLCRRLAGEDIAAVVIETRDADGLPVPAAIRRWVERNPRVLVVVWTAGGDAALREVLDLAVAGADVRLVLRRRDDLGVVLDRLLTSPSTPHPGAVPALLRGVVLALPAPIQPELTVATYHAWPYPSVRAWADSLQVTPQALNARLSAAHCATASIVLDSLTAAEIAIRCTLGIRLKDIAAAMGWLDDRPLRRRLGRLGCKAEELGDEADFRALIPRIVEAITRSGGIRSRKRAAAASAKP
jgi:hypothetical protein